MEHDNESQEQISKKDSSQHEYEEKIITINDFENNPTKKTRINSPHSLYAIKANCLTMDELYFLPYNKFLKLYPETIRMNDKIRKQRYNFLENIRNAKIQEVKRFRLELINAEMEKEKEKEKEKKPKSNKRKSIVIEHEEKLAGKEIEIMKKKNDLELAGIVKFELDKDLLLDKVKKENDLLNKQSKLNTESNLNDKKDNKKEKINREDNYSMPIEVEENTTLAENKYKIIQARKLNDYKLKQIKIEQKLQRIANKKEEQKYKENIKKKQKNDAIQQNLTDTQRKNEEKKEEIRKEYQRKELSTYELKKKQ